MSGNKIALANVIEKRPQVKISKSFDNYKELVQFVENYLNKENILYEIENNRVFVKITKLY